MPEHPGTRGVFRPLLPGASAESTNRLHIAEMAELVRDGVISHVHVLCIPGPGKENRDTAEFIRDTGIPVTLHAPYHVHGVNPCEPGMYRAPSWFTGRSFTDDAMAGTLEAADILDAPLVVVHAGAFSTAGPGDATACFLDFLDQWADPRIVIENLPVTFRGVRMLGNTARELQALTAGSDTGCCLDFAHLWCSAVSLKVPYRDLLSAFSSLPVRYHHLTKCGPGGVKDEHRGLDDPGGDLPVGEVFTWLRSRRDIPTALEYRGGGMYNRRQAGIFRDLLDPGE